MILGGVLLMMGFIAYLAGLVADLISFNRQLQEMTLERVRRMKLEQCTEAAAEEGGNSSATKNRLESSRTTESSLP